MSNYYTPNRFSVLVSVIIDAFEKILALVESSRQSKDLLGQFSIKTTACYLHAKKELITIFNPLDTLFAGKGWEGNLA